MAATKDVNRGKEKAAYDDAISGLTAIKWYEKGYASVMSGDHSNAINAFTKAIELEPKYTGAYITRGIAYGELGNYRQAIENFKKAIELNPELTEAYYNRGLAYGSLGNHRQAIEDYSKAIELNPKDEGTYNNRGATYGSLGNYRQAIEDYNRAIELNPKLTKAYYNRSITYYRLGKYDQSIKDYNKAIELNPKIEVDISSPTSSDKPPQARAQESESSIDTDERYKGIKAIVLKNGDVIEGQIISMDPDIVKIRTKDGKVLSYSFKFEVQRLITE